MMGTICEDFSGFIVACFARYYLLHFSSRSSFMRYLIILHGSYGYVYSVSFSVDEKQAC